jgi:hypothetical protein
VRYFITFLQYAFVFSPALLFAQSPQRTITGVVTSFEESLPIEGVRVSVKGTNKNSGTQPDGIYYITINTEDSILVFSFPGYESKEIKLGSSREYNVILHAVGNQEHLYVKIEHAALFDRCRL